MLKTIGLAVWLINLSAAAFTVFSFSLAVFPELTEAVPPTAMDVIERYHGIRNQALAEVGLSLESSDAEAGARGLIVDDSGGTTFGSVVDLVLGIVLVLFLYFVTSRFVFRRG